MKRRSFLQTGLYALLGSSIFARPAFGQSAHSMHAAPMSSSHDIRLKESLFPKGKALQGLNSLHNQSTVAQKFSGTLTAAPHVTTLIPRHQTEMWSYNRSIVGPLIEVFEEDSIELNFHNQLPQASTIHWHGLAVPSSQDGNPHDLVKTGSSRTYRFTLPRGSAGTYWYHPHPHHDTAEQVFRGLAGPLIVRSKEDPLKHLPEQHWFISDLRLDAKAQIPANTAFDWMNGREGEFVLINGQYQPNISIQGVQRIRIWNACSARYLKLHIPQCNIIMVGSDGGLLEKPSKSMDSILLCPAERVEIIIQGPNTQTALIAQPYNRQKMGETFNAKDIRLAQVRTLNCANFQAPSVLRTIARFGDATRTQKLIFSEDMRHMDHMTNMTLSDMMPMLQQMFLINGKSFDMQRVDLQSTLGAIELWEIRNDSHMDHPFHIHGTQFQVVSTQRTGEPPQSYPLMWKDTINLRPNETVRLKMQHTGQPGLRMYHCHILEHESLGMMGVLKVT